VGVDLLAGAARPGPTVPRGTAELVDVLRAASGWVGVERHTDRRKVAASVLRGVAPDAEAVGSVTATSSRGLRRQEPRVRSQRTRAPAGCAPVRISLVTVLTEKVEWALDDPGSAGPLSLSRARPPTYFTGGPGDG
jgi:hypothetical protein